MAGPLTGLRVVDFARAGWAGSGSGARTLLDLGADVIKIEPPTGRTFPGAPFPVNNGVSGYYAQQNAGKRNVSVDLNVPARVSWCSGSATRPTIVVENFRPGTLGFFGLDYETLAARNPRLIYASISGYARRPWRGRMAYAPAVHAEAGLLPSQCPPFRRRAGGAARREPCRTPTSMPACRGVIAILGGAP